MQLSPASFALAPPGASVGDNQNPNPASENPIVDGGSASAPTGDSSSNCDPNSYDSTRETSNATTVSYNLPKESTPAELDADLAQGSNAPVLKGTDPTQGLSTPSPLPPIPPPRSKRAKLTNAHANSSVEESFLGAPVAFIETIDSQAVTLKGLARAKRTISVLKNASPS